MSQTEEQKRAFAAYDFEGDERWREYRSNLTIPPGRTDEDRIIRKYKQKYYRQYIDPDFEVESAPASTTSSSSSSGAAASSRSPSSYAAAGGSRGGASPASAGGGAGAAAGGRGGGAAATRASPDWENALFLVKTGVLVMSVLAIVPLIPFGLAARGFRWAILGSMAASAFSIWLRCGWPASWQWAALKEWLQLAITHPEFLVFFHALVFLPSLRPIALAVVPLAISSVLFVARHLQQNYNRARLYKDYLERPCRWLTGNVAILQTYEAQTEIGLGFFLIFTLLSPQRNLLQTLMYWQLLKLKLHSPVSSWLHRSVWSAIGQMVEPLINTYTPFLASPLQYVKRWFLTVG